MNEKKNEKTVHTNQCISLDSRGLFFSLLLLLHGCLERARIVKWFASIESAALKICCRCRTWSNQLINCRHNNFIQSSFMAHTLTHHPPRKLLELYSLRLRFFFFLNFNSVVDYAVHELIKLKTIEPEKIYIAFTFAPKLLLVLLNFRFLRCPPENFCR